MDRPWHRHYAEGVPQTVALPDVPLTQLLADSVANHGELTAIRYYGEAIDFAQLDALSNRFATALTEL